MKKTLNSMGRAVSRRSLVAFGLTALLAGTLAGCGAKPADTAGSAEGSAPAKAVELQIFAANSLEKAMPEVQALYTEKTGVTFADTQFKASGDLIEQMRAGAQVDALITASKGTMDDAVAVELVDEATRLDMFVNDLVVVKAEGSDVEIASLEDVKNIEGKVAIGDAVTVPAGKYANQALNTIGLYTGAAGDDGNFVFKHSASSLLGVLVQGFDQKTHRTKAVVAGEHGRLGIFHPAVIEVLTAVAQGQYKGREGIPGTLAKAIRLLPAIGDKNLSHFHVAGVGDRIFVLGHQVLILRDTHDGDLTFFHMMIPSQWSISCWMI